MVVPAGGGEATVAARFCARSTVAGGCEVTYRNHGTHAEAIEIVFDPRVMSYRMLLKFFFQIHDPTTRNRQGNDVGTRYRSAIFYVSGEQSRSVSRKTPSPMSRPPVSGRARW